MRPGSEEHRRLMCDWFVDSHRPLDVDALKWPALSGEERRFLASLPIWDEAVNTEHDTALVVRAMADQESDPLLAEAIALQAFEEERHSRLVTVLCERYGISVTRRPPPSLDDPVWPFRRSGWGECVDSFVAVGVFAVAKEAEIVAKELVTLFDLVMQEEARHIVFFENWRQYRARHTGRLASPSADLVALAADLGQRMRLALGTSTSAGRRDDNFLLAGAKVLEGITPRSFVDLCLAEHARRVAPFDPALLRPRTIPSLAQIFRVFLPDTPVRAAS